MLLVIQLGQTSNLIQLILIAIELVFVLWDFLCVFTGWTPIGSTNFEFHVNGETAKPSKVVSSIAFVISIALILLIGWWLYSVIKKTQRWVVAKNEFEAMNQQGILHTVKYSS